MKLVILGSVKEKKNNKIVAYKKSTGKPFVLTAKDTDTYMKDAVRQLKEQFEGYKITHYPILIQMVFFYESKRRKDIDNSMTTILDCMKEAGIIEDDDVTHVNELYAFFGGYDKDDPRVEILLED
jgi:Holliday junction resolvase RusA-like endonuclease